ncbi:MAG: type II toxin-antitoxin system VapC family toxin [bacterium]
MYTLDTNAIIYYFKNDRDAVPILEEIFAKDIPIYVSSITEIELFGFSNLSNKETNQIEDILRTLAIIPVDSRIARIAGTLRRNYNLKIADSVIAATAMFTGSTLLTRNFKDFQKIPNLLLQKI